MFYLSIRFNIVDFEVFSAVGKITANVLALGEVANFVTEFFRLR